MSSFTTASFNVPIPSKRSGNSSIMWAFQSGLNLVSMSTGGGSWSLLWFGMLNPLGNPLTMSTAIFLQTQWLSQLTVTKLNALQKLNLVGSWYCSCQSCRRYIFFMVFAWVQVTLTLPTILTDCLLYPTTWTSLHGCNSSFPFNLRLHLPQLQCLASLSPGYHKPLCWKKSALMTSGWMWSVYWAATVSCNIGSNYQLNLPCPQCLRLV